MSKKEYIVLDIETVEEEKINPFVLDYYDKKKWAKKRNREEVEKLDKQLLPVFAKVVCACLKDSDGNSYTFKGNEKGILEGIWNIVEKKLMDGHTIVSFNGYEFDIPFLKMRSSILGITHPNISNKKYANDLHFDVRMELTGWDKYQLGNLEFWAHVFGVKVGTTVISGDEILDHYKRGEIDKIIEHCQEDVRITEEIYLKMIS